MTQLQSKFMVPPTVSAPRAADWAAAIAVSLLDGLARLAHRLGQPRHDEPRNAEELLDLANRVERDSPSYAAELRWIATQGPHAAK